MLAAGDDFTTTQSSLQSTDAGHDVSHRAPRMADHVIGIAAFILPEHRPAAPHRAEPACSPARTGPTRREPRP